MSSASSSKHRSLDSEPGVGTTPPLQSPTSPMSQTPLLPPTGQVSVARAEAAFRAVESELKGSLRRSQSLSHARSRASARETDPAAAADLEKGGGGGAPSSDDDADEPFDLEAMLRGDRAAAAAEGARFKAIGVLWRGLAVRGMGGGGKAFVQTFPSAFVRFFNVWPRLKKLVGACGCGTGGVGQQAEILSDFRGLVKPGEMLLVLGRPGSGCTSFLKVISNQRFGYSSVDGEVLYGPFDHEMFEKRYRGEAVYNAEDESQSMHPTLTVRQTLDFALDTKIPGSRPGGLSKREFKDKVIDMLLKMFNIEHTENTFVGGPFVRGISGGERKRASIAEMMVTNASVCAWDSPTRGLDASTAVDYVRSIRVLSDIHRTSTFITAYQVSESIYREFDKVMVLHQGRLAYFGPAKSARGYFESLGYLSKPRQTTADYLTGCTDPFEREYRPGRSAKNVPTTPQELAESFDRSSIAADLERDMAAYQRQLETETQVREDFLTAMKQSKFRTSARNVYTIPFYLQVWALTKRQFLLKKQDTFALTVSWTTVLLIAMLLSTLWVNQPQTSSGAFTRGGVIFISFLFNGFQAFGELAGTMLGRPIISKHRAYAFYRPSALWIAQVFVDMAFQSLVIAAFALMVYFSTGLVREPGAFFAFLVTIMSGYLCMTLVFRTIGILSRDFDIAMRAAAMLIAMLVLTSGYPIQYPKQKVWIRWLFWVNPAGLGFSSLMVNEFKRLNLLCADQSLIPNGPGYSNLNYQVCTLLGSVPGNPIVSGTAYVKALFGYNIKDQWRNFSFIWILVIFFLTMTIILGEYINWGASGRTITLFAKEDKKRKKLNEALMARKEIRGTVNDNNQAANIAITSKSVLTWEAINYDVPVPSGHKRILNNVYGYVKPGVLTALMGASGAGKTTLLDVLAERKNIGIIHGDIFVDGRKPGLAFQRGTSYAEQLDVHEPAQTVREALRFSADLRQPYDTPQEDKYAYVEEVISLLELEDIADAIIGSPEAGLAPDQRKLLTIGVELAAKPQLLLFLDEPTTGLDSQSAWNIARFLRKLTGAGQAVLCTIHQPNSALFQQFDRLLLLQKGGECVYFGDIGDDAAVLRDYFRRNGAECPRDANPAEWMLDAVGAGLTPRLGDRDWGEVWAASAEFARLQREIVDIKAAAAQRASAAGQEGQREYATPLWHQIKHVVARQSLSFWRTPNYGFTRLFNHLSIALIAGLIFIHLDDSRQSLQDRIFLIFQFTVLPAIILAQVQPKYAQARAIAHREQAAKAYRTLPFALSMVVAETPYSVLCAVGFFLPIHYMPGMQNAPDRAGYELLMTLIVELFAVALGQMVAAATPSPKISALLNPPIIITFALFSGVTIPAVSMPRFWRVWLWQLDPFSRLIGGMLVTELQGRPVVCRPEELSVFNAPPGTTCGAYMAPFFARGGPGYIVSNATTRCEYCAYKVGDEFFEALGYSFSHRWRDLGIISAYILSSILLTMLAARFLNFNRR